MSKPSLRQDQVIAIVLGAIAVLVVAVGATAADGTTLLIGLTGFALFLLIGVYGFVAARYAKRSLRVAVGLAAGWMLLPLLLYPAVMLVWGAPGSGSGANPSPSHSRTVITYRNGTEVERSTEGGSGSGNGPGAALILPCIVWTWIAAIFVYLGYKSQPRHSLG